MHLWFEVLRREPVHARIQSRLIDSDPRTFYQLPTWQFLNRFAQPETAGVHRAVYVHVVPLVPENRNASQGCAPLPFEVGASDGECSLVAQADPFYGMKNDSYTTISL